MNDLWAYDIKQCTFSHDFWAPLADLLQWACLVASIAGNKSNLPHRLRLDVQGMFLPRIRASCTCSVGPTECTITTIRGRSTLQQVHGQSSRVSAIFRFRERDTQPPLSMM